MINLILQWNNSAIYEADDKSRGYSSALPINVQIQRLHHRDTAWRRVPRFVSVDWRFVIGGWAETGFRPMDVYL
jgi:hypothetical protein